MKDFDDFSSSDSVGKRRKTIVFFVFLCLISSFAGGVYITKSKDAPFVHRKHTNWAIGIYTGDSPFDLRLPGKIRNPVLTSEDVSDARAEFVADPFMVYENGTWYMFLEVYNADSHQGDIAMATSGDALEWTYQQIVLDEPFHLSYPFVFKWKDEYYMIPETLQPNAIRLYRASNFPKQWEFVATLLEGKYADATIFHFNQKWWIFACTRPYKHDTLRLYYSDELKGPWIEHPMSPIIANNANIARPGGRVIVVEDKVVRFTQDDDPTYGNQVRAFEIIELTTTRYEETEVPGNPVLEASGTGWNARGMHHIDLHQNDENKWIACVDGQGEKLVLSFKWLFRLFIPNR